MARGSTQSQGRAARSEGLVAPSGIPSYPPADNEVIFGWQKGNRDALLPTSVRKEINKNRNTMMANIADAQNVLAKRDRAEYVRMLGGEENAKKVDDMIERGVMRRDLLRKDGRIDQQERFNNELAEAGRTPLRKDDPLLVNAVSNYFAAQSLGHNATYEMLGADGNGYAKTRSFEPVYNKELKAWEMVRYANPLLNSDDPKDYYTEKGWFAVKGSPNDKTLETKLKKVAIVMNTFIED